MQAVGMVNVRKLAGKVQCLPQRLAAGREFTAAHSRRNRQSPAEREISPRQKKRVYLANLAELPNGVFVKIDDWKENAYLVWNDRLLLWTAGGYSGQMKLPKDAEVEVLTPKSTVEAIRSGYVPDIHQSAVGAR